MKLTNNEKLRTVVQTVCYRWINWPMIVLTFLGILGAMALAFGLVDNTLTAFGIFAVVMAVLLILLNRINIVVWQWAYDPERPWAGHEDEIAAAAKLREEAEARAKNGTNTVDPNQMSMDEL